MRKLCVFLLFVCANGSAHAGTKTTFAQLTGILSELQTLKRTDETVANRLKMLELSEPMSPDQMQTLAHFEPGPLSLTQIHILALASAMLPPVADDIPVAPAPNHVAQVELMHKAVASMKLFAQVPPLHAERDAVEFRNGPEALHFSTGQPSAMAIGDPGVAPDSPYFRLLGEQKTPVTLQLGVELPRPKGKGEDASHLYSPAPAGGTGLLLSTIFLDAAAGNMGFERWQTVAGKQVAVFSFRVDRKKSSYHINYCCFPTTQSTGDAMGGVGAYGVANEFGAFKSTPGYHGEFYIEPATGAILRLIVQVDLKPEDPIKQEDTRIDYGFVTVHGVSYLAPVELMEFSAVSLSGDSNRRMSVRRSLVNLKYTGFTTAQ